MLINMNYGKMGYTLELPDSWDVTVIEKKPMPPLNDPSEAARGALSAPAGSRSLREEAKGRRSACVLICDITRPVPNGIILPEVVGELIEGGINPDNITVLVATGLHRPNEGEELRELVGNDWVLQTVRVENHYAKNDDDHVLVGTTRSGIPAKLDRRFVEADLKIATGLIEPHFMAGYSGGRKVIAPGIAHRDTITRFHTAHFLEHPNAANCILDGNPLHEELIQIARMLGPVFAVNTVIDDRRRLSFVNFGDIEASHGEAVSFMRKYAEVEVFQKFPTVITTGGGYPLDKTYYQTVKGMVGAMDLLAPGGNIFILSECSEGMGSPDYVDAQKRLVSLGADAFLQCLMPKNHADIDEWQTEMQLKPMRIGNIHLFSDCLSQGECLLTGIHQAQDPAESIKQTVEASGDRRVAVIPEGPYVIPRFTRYNH